MLKKFWNFLYFFKYYYNHLTRKMPLDEFEDYDEYWEKREQRYYGLNRSKIISRYIKPNATILDIGCGDGSLMEYLATHNSPKKVIGIDISNVALEIVRKRGFEGHQIDMTREAFVEFMSDKKFDYIIITEVLEHITDPEIVVKNLKGKFRESLFVSIPNAAFIMHRLRLILGKFPITTIVHHIKEHIRFWSVSDFKYWVNYLGFEIKSVDASKSIRIFNKLGKVSPSLFGEQIIYQLVEKHDVN